MFIINNLKLFIGIALGMMALAVTILLVFGMRYGIDFTGGTIIEINYAERPEKVLVIETLENQIEQSVQVQELGESGYVVRTGFISEAAREGLQGAVMTTGEDVTIDRLNTIGPTIGSELRQKALLAIGIVVIAIVLFVAYSFRQVAGPVSSWHYGFAAIFALVHDILLPVGMFGLLGVLAGYEVDVLFVTALLAILGFSVNDTIVIFDRIRENLLRNKEANLKESFPDTVGRSLNESFARSINTSLTTLFVLLMLFVLGGATTQPFALTLIAGVVAGTYSSLFFASPLLVFLSQAHEAGK